MPHRRVNDEKNSMYGKVSHEERLLLRVSSYALAQDVLSSAKFLSHVILTLPKTEYWGRWAPDFTWNSELCVGITWPVVVNIFPLEYYFNYTDFEVYIL